MSTHFALQMVDSIEIDTSNIRKYGDYRLPQTARSAAHDAKGKLRFRYESLDETVLDSFYLSE